MKNLDDELRDVLRREEPSDGFVERVIARAGEAHSRPGLRPGVNETIRLKPDPTYRTARRFPVRWLAAAAVVVAVAGGAIEYRIAQLERARAEQAAGEAAGERVMLGLQIAGSKLHLVQARINRLHEQTGRNPIQ